MRRATTRRCAVVVPIVLALVAAAPTAADAKPLTKRAATKELERFAKSAVSVLQDASDSPYPGVVATVKSQAASCKTPQRRALRTDCVAVWDVQWRQTADGADLGPGKCQVTLTVFSKRHRLSSKLRQFV